jgi:hypothetical protein
MKIGMSKAITLIVDGYATLSDRQALQDLKLHRRGLLRHLQETSGLDLSKSIYQISDELDVVEAGLARLDQ